MEEFLYILLGILVILIIVYLIVATADGGVQGTASNIHLQPIPIVLPNGGTMVTQWWHKLFYYQDRRNKWKL